MVILLAGGGEEERTCDSAPWPVQGRSSNQIALLMTPIRAKETMDDEEEEEEEEEELLQVVHLTLSAPTALVCRMMALIGAGSGGRTIMRRRAGS